jgi:hypothetical protein
MFEDVTSVRETVENTYYDGVEDVGTDECAQRKGYVYITIFFDLT